MGTRRPTLTLTAQFSTALPPPPEAHHGARLLAGFIEGLQNDYFPFKVEGDCLYGANRTEGGWWLWVFNNKGVTKFADTPHAVDHAFDVDVTVSCANGDIAAVKELLTAKSLPVENGAFRYRVAAGDLAVFDIRTREERP